MPQTPFALEQNIGDDLVMLYDCTILNWDYLTNVCWCFRRGKAALTGLENDKDVSSLIVYVFHSAFRVENCDSGVTSTQ